MDNALDILNYSDFLFVVPVKCRSIIGYELYRAPPPPPQKKKTIKGRLILYVHVFSVPKTMSSSENLYFSVLFGVIFVKILKNVVFEHIHSNQILIKFTFIDNNE